MSALCQKRTLAELLDHLVGGSALVQTKPRELDHGEEVGGELVVAGSDAAEVLQLREEALDQVALAVEALAEAGFPAPVALGRDVGRGALVLDQLADAICTAIISACRWRERVPVPGRGRHSSLVRSILFSSFNLIRASSCESTPMTRNESHTDGV